METRGGFNGAFCSFEEVIKTQNFTTLMRKLDIFLCERKNKIFSEVKKVTGHCLMLVAGSTKYQQGSKV